MTTGRLPRDCWATPPWLFQALNREFSFDLDACAEKHNAKCKLWLNDCLNQEWPGTGPAFLNPPYSREIMVPILHRAIEESQKRTVVCVLPSRTETDWFKELLVEKASEIRFIRGRVAFVPPPGMTLSPAGNRPVFATLIAVYGTGPLRIRSMVAPKNSALKARCGELF